MVRSGPGLGGILASQCDYFQTVKGGGHGDYKLLTYAPSTVQEAVDILYYAFDKADEYRTPVCILGDGLLGQIMEPVTFPEMKEMPDPSTKSWAVTGTHHGKDKTLAAPFTSTLIWARRRTTIWWKSLKESLKKRRSARSSCATTPKSY